MRRVDYDKEQHQDYARGRVVTEQQREVWISAFAAALPERRPLAGLDVGSGTGRFAPAMAEAFGPVIGVEPSVRMREVAEAQSRHPQVQYVPGSAEELPVPTSSADYALMSYSWHHVQDKPRAIRELARAVKPGGRLLLRTNFGDHHPRPWWQEHFPRGYEADAAMFQPLHEVVETFTSAGWRVVSFGTITEPSAGTLAEMLERLRLRTLSFFAQLTPEEIEIGFDRIEEFVAADPEAPAPTFAEPLLVLTNAADA